MQDMSVSTCAVLRCQNDAAEVWHVSRPEPRDYRVCARHRQAIRDGALWARDTSDDAVLLLEGDANFTMPNVLRGYRIGGGALAEVVEGEREYVLRLELTHGHLGVPQDRELTLYLPLTVAGPFAAALQRFVDSWPAPPDGEGPSGD
jgi:hypothetical protein